MDSLPPDDSPSSERRNLADALAHERNVLRTMIDLIPAFIYAKDAQSRFTAANKLVANRMGVEPADLIGKTDFDFFPREHAEKFFADEQALIQSGVPLIDSEELAFDQTRGKDRVIAWRSAPLVDENGDVVRIIAGGIDITDRKRREIDLQRQRDFANTVADTIPSFIVLTDHDANVVPFGANRAFSAAVGRSLEELSGRSFLEIVARDDEFAARMAIAGAAGAS